MEEAIYLLYKDIRVRHIGPLSARLPEAHPSNSVGIATEAHAARSGLAWAILCATVLLGLSCTGRAIIPVGSITCPTRSEALPTGKKVLRASDALTHACASAPCFQFGPLACTQWRPDAPRGPPPCNWTSTLLCHPWAAGIPGHRCVPHAPQAFTSGRKHPKF